MAVHPFEAKSYFSVMGMLLMLFIGYRYPPQEDKIKCERLRS